MSAHDDADAFHAYYARRREQARLEAGAGRLEFERTLAILERHLPHAPARVADIGGGPGRYSLWLAQRGYRVDHRDIVELHVEQLRATLSPEHAIDTRPGDARAVDLDDASVDAVLLLGPLYHLPDRSDRITALREAARVVRPGGPVVAAAISRWAVRLDGGLRLRAYREFTDFPPLLEANEATGWFAPLEPGGFTAFTHRPDELAAEVAAAGLELSELAGVEGPPGFLPDLEERMGDPADREAVFAAARAFEHVPELLGASPHLLAVATRGRDQL